MALWRGPALVEFVDEEWARPLATHSEEPAGAEDLWFATQRAAGFGEDIIPRLEAACAAEPLRESRWEQLILALAEAGRPARPCGPTAGSARPPATRWGEPIAGAAEPRTGAPAPGRRTGHIQHRATPTTCGRFQPEGCRSSPPKPPTCEEARRRQTNQRWRRWTKLVEAPEPAAPVLPSPLALLADPATFVGRAQERERLTELWRRAAAGQLMLGLVTGEAGIGKTRPVAEFAAEVHRRGWSCSARFGFPGLGDSVRAVRTRAHGRRRLVVGRRAAPTRRTGGAAAVSTVAGAGVSSRGGTPSAAGSDLVTDAVIVRADLFERGCAYLYGAAASGPLLVVVEDLHWSTPTTRDALRHVVRAGGAVPILLVATTRDSAPNLDPGLSRFLSALGRFATSNTSRSGLSSADVAALLADVGAGANVDADRVHSETDGNPLFVREIASSTRGRIAALPDLLTSRYELLSADDLDVIDVAAVIGPVFDADFVAAAVDRPIGQVLEALERAEAVGLISATRERPGRFRGCRSAAGAHRALRRPANQPAGASARSRGRGIATPRRRRPCPTRAGPSRL